MRWEKVEVGEGPGERWGHTCNNVKGGRFLYLFGGYDKFNCRTNQVHVFDTEKQSWSQPTIKGFPPAPKDSHSCTTVGDNLLVFGGTDGTNVLKDLHILDTSTHTWISPTVRGEGPEAREGHGEALIGKRLFIFGGCGRSADNHEIDFNDIYILNTETFFWKCATTLGIPPSPRDSHTCSSWKNKIIMIGGEEEYDYLSDVHILDTDTLIWRELRTPGQSLPSRAGHYTVSLGKKLFVFGGFTDAQILYNDLHMLDVEAGIWTKVTITPNGPSARFSVAGDCLDPFKGGVLVFIGGCNKSLEALDDMYYLHTGIAWENEQRPEKLSLGKQLKRKVGAGSSQPMTVLDYGLPSGRHVPLNESLPPSGKKQFVATVTESISIGYTFETVIDGKHVHGVVFSNKPSTMIPATDTSSRKRTAGAIGGAVSDNIDPNSLTSKVLKQNEKEDKWVVQGDDSESHEPHKEAVAAGTPSNPITAGASKTFEVSANPEPEAVSLNRNNDEQNRNDDEQNDTPKSLGENLKSDGANEATNSEGEVRTDDQTNVPISNIDAPRQARHDQKSDASTCNTNVLNPEAAESAMC